MVSLKNVNKYYNKNKSNALHVIDHTTLDLPSSGITAIFGRSGCGKTTLLNVIGGLDSFDSGEITVDGCSIKSQPDYIRNKYIGYIFQNYNLNPEKTVFENVADILRLCGEKDSGLIEQRVLKALADVGMDKFRNRTPDNLSGGQQQRIAIARATVKSPAIILADEPTGNLDEANTIAVMNMLRRISENCLVLLVTHEENLVDHYCDRIIEVSDGKVVNIRDNVPTVGYRRRLKNDIYIGEYEKQTFGSGNVTVDYYGEKPEEALNLKIVNDGGKLFVCFGDTKVTVIDSDSETVLREGIFESAEETVTEEQPFEPLPPLTEKKKSAYGKLFTFASSFKNGLSSAISGKKKTKKFMRACMILFGVVIVLFMSIYGRKLGDLLSIRSDVDPNLFFVNASDRKNIADEMETALKSADSGMLNYRYYGSIYSVLEGFGSNNIVLSPDYFSTFKNYDSISAEVFFLSFENSGDCSVIVGEKKTDNNSIWLSATAADKLIEKSSASYIKEYRDLLNVSTSDGYVITAIVDNGDGKEVAFKSELAIANEVLRNLNIRHVRISDDPSLTSGSTILVCPVGNHNPEANINGTVLKVIPREYYMSYSDWLRNRYPDRYYECEEFLLSGNLYEGKYWSGGKPKEDRLAEYALYAYGYFDEWVKECSEGHFAICYDLADYLYTKGKYDDAKYAAYGDADGNLSSRIYVYTVMYLRNHPGQIKEVSGALAAGLYDSFEREEDYYCSINYIIDSCYAMIDDSYWNSSDRSFDAEYYLVTEEDYLRISRGIDPDGGGFGWYDGRFVAVYSSDPGKTGAYLRNLLGEEDKNADIYDYKLVTPDDIADYRIKSSGKSIGGAAIAFAVVVILLCMCIYLIIRSTLMNRVKEVGINRAIGVSKSNIRFEFMTETVALALVSVVIGYALMSAVLFYLIRKTTLISTFIFYPVWYAVFVLIFIVGVCVVSGLLPINKILRRTPAEIISKYDI